MQDGGRFSQTLGDVHVQARRRVELAIECGEHCAAGVVVARHMRDKCRREPGRQLRVCVLRRSLGAIKKDHF